MKTFKLVIEGTSPLLHHRYPPEEVLQLLASKAGKKKQKIEATPRELAEKHVHQHGGNYVNPTEFFRQSFIIASSEYKLSNSSRKSLKSIAGAVLRPRTDFTVLVHPKTGEPLKNYEVDIRHGRNHLTGAVCCVRPRFDEWACEFEVDVDTELIPLEVVHQVLNDAGTKVGVGSFRVSNKGWFGRFRVREFVLAT